MIDFSFETLRSLGLNPAMVQNLQTQLAASNPIPQSIWELVRLCEVHRESVVVDNGTVRYSARCRPRLLNTLTEQGTVLVVGDWALASRENSEQAWIEQALEPLNRLVRRDADGTPHAVVSNVDTAFLAMGLDLDFNPARLERYLALVQGHGVLPVVVLTKADIAEAQDGTEAVARRVDTLRERIGNTVDILALDSRSGDAAKRLQPYLQSGQTVVLLGSSGTGKSTLTNTLLGSLVQDTGAVREHDSRGKHTTTSRSLHRLPGGACLIDTPGVRSLSPGLDAAALKHLYDDVTMLADGCRFRNCQHGDEPGCAVREGVHPDRLKNYHKLLRESRRDTMTPLDRQLQLATWKIRTKAARRRDSEKHQGA